jgi:hypothetical protein
MSHAMTLTISYEAENGHVEVITQHDFLAFWKEDDVIHWVTEGWTERDIARALAATRESYQQPEAKPR